MQNRNNILKSNVQHFLIGTTAQLFPILQPLQNDRAQAASASYLLFLNLLSFGETMGQEQLYYRQRFGKF